TIVFSLIVDEVPLTRLKADCDAKQWRPVYLDEVSIVLVRRTAQNEDLIRRFPVDCATAPLPRKPLPPTAASFHAYLNAGRILLVLKRNTEALAAADRAMTIFPNSAHGRLYRGKILYALQRDSEAEEEWKRALALAPREATPWGSLPAFHASVCFSLAQ